MRMTLILAESWASPDQIHMTFLSLFNLYAPYTTTQAITQHTRAL